MNDIREINLGDLASISSGFSLRVRFEDLEDGDAAVVQMKNVNLEGGVDWGGVGYASLPPARKISWLEVGDVIFVARGMRYYAAAIESIPGPAVCTQQFFVLKPRQKFCAAFLAWQINQRPAQGYFQRSAQGTQVLNIRRNVLESLKIALPSVEQQQTIVAYAKAAYEERKRLEAFIENRNLEMEAIARSLFDDDQKGTKS